MFEGLSVALGSIGHEIGAYVDSEVRYSGAKGGDKLELENIAGILGNINNKDLYYYMMGKKTRTGILALKFSNIVEKCENENIPLDPNMSKEISKKIERDENDVKEALFLRRQLIFLASHGIVDKKDIETYSDTSEYIAEWVEKNNNASPDANAIASEYRLDADKVAEVIRMAADYYKQYSAVKPFTYEQQPPQQQKQPTANAKKSNSKQQQQAAQ